MEQQPGPNYEKLDKRIGLDFKGNPRDWIKLINELIKKYGPGTTLGELAQKLGKLDENQTIINQSPDEDSKE